MAAAHVPGFARRSAQLLKELQEGDPSQSGRLRMRDAVVPFRK
jgi:hypothetical protein